MITSVGSNVIQSRAQVELLRQVSVFAHLDERLLSEIARRMTVKRWHASRHPDWPRGAR
jgi:hypothetical protein